MAPTLTQAMRELEKLQQMHERRPGCGKRELTEVEVCRRINLTLCKAVAGVANPREMALARQMHFILTGDPDNDAKAWGPKQYGTTVTIDLGKPNQVAPMAPTLVVRRRPVVDARALYLDDNGKAPAAQPHQALRHGGKDQR